MVPSDVKVEMAHLPNYPSASTFAQPLRDYLEEEVTAGRLVKVRADGKQSLYLPCGTWEARGQTC
jgi:hypothetical protein